jgi:hypothetical protein
VKTFESYPERLGFTVSGEQMILQTLSEKTVGDVHSSFGTMTASQPVRLCWSGHAALRMTTKKFINNYTKISCKLDTLPTLEMNLG